MTQVVASGGQALFEKTDDAILRVGSHLLCQIVTPSLDSALKLIFQGG